MGIELGLDPPGQVPVYGPILPVWMLSTCVASAGYGRNRERHFLEPEAYKAVVVPAMKQFDTNRCRRTRNAGCAVKDGIARNTAELIATNIGGDTYPSSGVCEVKFTYLRGAFCPKC